MFFSQIKSLSLFVNPEFYLPYALSTRFTAVLPSKEQHKLSELGALALTEQQWIQICIKSILALFIIFILFLNAKSAIKSPCPKYFLFEPNKSQDDRWYGVIKLNTQTDVNGAELELHFDKPVVQLGNWFGKVGSNSDHTRFTLKNENKIIRANTLEKVEIFVVYDYYDFPLPQLTKILFNGREICPNYEAEEISNAIILTTNINHPKCGVNLNAIALITNGQNTIEGQWPWHAAVYKLDGEQKQYICGGTLISEKHILTAAHCTTEETSTKPRDANSVTVTLGKYGMYILGKNEQTSDIAKVVVHPNFERTTLYNDIAILITSKPLQVTDYVRPVCLWEEDININSVVGKIGTVVGWGRDEHNNNVTEFLMEAQMPVVDRLKCILSQSTYFAKFTNENNFCAGFLNGTSVCNGDSGGGLVFEKTGTSGINARWQIRGIVSNTIAQSGTACDTNYYVIFTDVAKYLDWIQQAMG